MIGPAVTTLAVSSERHIVGLDGGSLAHERGEARRWSRGCAPARTLEGRAIRVRAEGARSR
jgi:hypothetical protein